MTDLRKAIEEIIRHTRANVQFSTNTPAAETNIQVETDAILALLSQERAALLDAIESKVIGEDYEESDEMIPTARLAASWRNHEHDKQRKLLADMRGE